MAAWMLGYSVDSCRHSVILGGNSKEKKKVPKKPISKRMTMGIAHLSILSTIEDKLVGGL
jgi:hypothetical protein